MVPSFLDIRPEAVRAARPKPCWIGTGVAAHYNPIGQAENGALSGYETGIIKMNIFSLSLIETILQCIVVLLQSILGSTLPGFFADSLG